MNINKWTPLFQIPRFITRERGQNSPLFIDLTKLNRDPKFERNDSDPYLTQDPK